MVMTNKINLKIDIAKNAPINHNMPILRYQTPNLNFIGHNGNMTSAKTITKAPTA